MIFNSYPSLRFQYSHGERKDLDIHCYSKDLFYPIIIIGTAWDKDCAPCFISQCPCPLTEDSCSLRSNEKLFRKLFQEAILYLLFSSCLSHIKWAVFDTKPWKVVSLLCDKLGPLRLVCHIPWGMLWKVVVLWVPDLVMQQRLPDLMSLERDSFGNWKQKASIYSIRFIINE